MINVLKRLNLPFFVKNRINIKKTEKRYVQMILEYGMIWMETEEYQKEVEHV